MTPKKVLAASTLKAEQLDNSAKERAMHRRRVIDIGDYFPAGPSKKPRAKRTAKAGYDQIEDRRSFPRPPTRGR